MSAAAASTSEPSAPWVQRLYDRAPVGPGGVGLALVAGLAVLYLGMELALGRFAGEAGLDLVGMGLLTLLLALLLAYALTANVAVAREAQRNLRRLQAVGLVPEGDAGAARGRLTRPSRAVLVGGSLFGLAVSLVAPLLEIQAEPWHPYDPRGWVPESAWHRVLTPLVGWWMGRLLGRIGAVSAVFSRLASGLRTHDLFAPDATAPFVRQGLAQALAVVGFVALLAFYLVDVQRYGLMFVVVGAVTVLGASAGLLLPVWGVQRRLREMKRAELRRVDAALRGEEGALAGSPLAARADDARIADLVAWRGLVAQAREWPFDASSLRRFGLYLAIPLGSWSGAALVERMIDTLLA